MPEDCDMAARDDTFFVESFCVGPVQTNIYLVGCTETGEAAMIDAGGDPETVLETAASHDLEITKILQTHAHVDHVAGLGPLKEATDAPIYLHPDESTLYQSAPQQGQMFGIPVDPLPEVDVYLEEGDTIDVGTHTADVLHLPGHSPGGIGFHFADQQAIFSGDVLFRGSIGRVDLPGADTEAMKQSLARLQALSDETRIYPGHMSETTIGRERRDNPYLSRDW
jgi:glyoxylase-like metal-dependent hydrolase (beta-lactamase superfamily II)